MIASRDCCQGEGRVFDNAAIKICQVLNDLIDQAKAHAIKHPDQQQGDLRMKYLLQLELLKTASMEHENHEMREVHHPADA